ncbi:MAG: hypothetical protein ACPGWR_28700 [Ardenticatenaceae bacterium]
MIEITLRKSTHVALVSDQDADQAAYEWSLSAALGVIRYDGERHVILARAITEAADGSFVVHVDKNKRNWATKLKRDRKEV